MKRLVIGFLLVLLGAVLVLVAGTGWAVLMGLGVVLTGVSLVVSEAYSDAQRRHRRMRGEE